MCFIDNRIIDAEVNLIAKTLTCAVPVMNQDCFDLVVMDSHGRKFTHEDKNSTED